MEGIHMIRRIVAGSAVGAVGVLGLTALPASAGTIGPNVNLKMNASSVLKFKPKTLSLIAHGGKCKATNYSFSITNKSGSTQNIDFGGNPFITNLASGSEALVCQGLGTGTYTVVGTAASLTVTESS
jgi:hypothetical protein